MKNLILDRAINEVVNDDREIISTRLREDIRDEWRKQGIELRDCIVEQLLPIWWIAYVVKN